MIIEANVDGIIGPTHHYAGLSLGNRASMAHEGLVSNPREAALQGLAKMRRLAALGVKQAFFPPLERPSLQMLRAFGFDGPPEEVLRRAWEEVPRLFAAACSASSMWMANAATVSAAQDTGDSRVHFTPANLVSNLHRSFEAAEVGPLLQKFFADSRFYRHHPPLGGGLCFGDEGAANHMRLAAVHGGPGVEVFVYGGSALGFERPRPKRYPARQMLEASQTIARFHELRLEACVFLQQHPEAIDAGVFHNDVIATSNEGVLLYHESAFLEEEAAIQEIEQKYNERCDAELCVIRVPKQRITLGEAVSSYLFNSQIVTLPDGRMVLFAAMECRETTSVADFISEMISSRSNPIDEVHYVDLRGSMFNGGGPACLRLRVVLDEAAWEMLPKGFKITDEKADQLEGWIRRYYRERLTLADMADISFLREVQGALQELAVLMR